MDAIPKQYNEVPINGLEDHYDRFCNDRLNDLVQMKLMLDNNEYEGIQRMTHQWKGCCSPFGFGYLLYFSLAIESCITSGSYKNIDLIVKDIRQYLNLKNRTN